MISSTSFSLPTTDLATSSPSSSAADSASHNSDAFAQALDKASNETNSSDKNTADNKGKSVESRGKKSDAPAKDDATDAVKKDDAAPAKTDDSTKTADKPKADKPDATDNAQTADAKPAVVATPVVAPELPIIQTVDVAVVADVQAPATAVVTPALPTTPLPTAPAVPALAAQTTLDPKLDVKADDSKTALTQPATTAQLPELTGDAAKPDAPKVDASATSPLPAQATDAKVDTSQLQTQPAAVAQLADVVKELAPKAEAAKVESTVQQVDATLQTIAPKLDTTSPLAAAPKIAQQVATEPFRQVMNVVHPLRGRDGEYNITIALNPETLGHVEIQVSVQNNSVSMQMNADNPSARQILRDSMNELRNALSESGLQAGSLDVGTQDPGQQARDQNTNTNNRNLAGDIEVDNDDFFTRLATTATKTPDGPLDLRL